MGGGLDAVFRYVCERSSTLPGCYYRDRMELAQWYLEDAHTAAGPTHIEAPESDEDLEAEREEDETWRAEHGYPSASSHAYEDVEDDHLIPY